MANDPVNLLYRLRYTLQAATGAVPDAELLIRYARTGDQAAFELILWRHGPMVWSVCRRGLSHAQDAEDAFQAVFLALARRAAVLRDGACLAGWLYRVAHRTALTVRTARRRRACLGEISADLPTHAAADDPVQGASASELARLLDDEIARLPERYRLPFILCQLEGRSQAEAAAELQCPVGTVESRLHRARRLLRSRLARRGVSLPATLLATGAPAALRAATLQALAAPVAAAGLPAALLAERVLRSLELGTLKKGLGGILAACLVVTGFSLAALRPSGPPSVSAAAAPAAARTSPDDVPLPAEALARVGSPRLRHGGVIASVAFSPQGKWIASASTDHTARVWEAATGRMCLRVPLEGAAGGLFRVSFPSAGQSLVIVDNKSCRTVDALTGKEQAAHPVPARGTVAALAPDGSLFATAGQGKGVSVHDTRTGKVRHNLPLKGLGAHAAAFSADGRSIAVLWQSDFLIAMKGDVGELQVFDAGTGKPRCSVNDEKRRLAAPALSADGKTVAALSCTGAGETVVLWDADSGKRTRRITGLEPTSSCIAFSPDGKLLAVGNLLRLWLQLFDVASGKEVRRLRCWPSVTALAFSPDGQTLAAGKSEGTIALWDVTTGKPRPATSDPDGGVLQLQFSDGGRSLLSLAGNITVRDWRTGRIAGRYPDPRTDLFLGLSVSLDGKLLAVRDGAAAVRLLEARTGKERHLLKGHRLGVEKTLFAPDNRRLFTMGHDKTVRVWDVATGKPVHCLAIGGVNSASGLAVSGDGNVLAALCSTAPGAPQEICLWDTRSGTQLRRLSVRAEDGRALALSPDGAWIACACQGSGARDGSRGTVLVWEVATGRQRRTFAGHRGPVYGVSFSPDGRMLATGGADRTLRLWEMATGKERHRFSGHESAVVRVAFSPDGRYLAASSADAPVFVWDVTGTGRRPAAAAWRAGERDRLWQELGSPDAAAGFKALRQLLASPAAARDLLRDRLEPASAQDRERLRQLLRDLDSDDFPTRERAVVALKKVAEDIEGMLRRERQTTRSLEVRRRLDEVLRSVKDMSQVRLRQIRAIEVLELLATPEAVALLDRLAAGAAGLPLTDEAAAARLRVRRQTGR